jgi:glyoxylate reductase
MSEEVERRSVLVTRAVPQNTLDTLTGAGLELRHWNQEDPMPRAALLSEVQHVHGLLSMISERVDREFLGAAPLLKVVANFAVGYDNIDVPACTARGVVVCNTPGVLTETTADLAWALILGIARRVGEGIELVKQGDWKMWSPQFMLGTDVHHATLGIVGLGEIGWQVARRAFGFDMRVLYTSRRQRPDLEAEARGQLEYVDLETLLRECDFVTLHIALSSETRHLIGPEELALMKPTAFLINTSRGPIIDQQALYTACGSGQIGGAALDVTDPEPMPPTDSLLDLPNVIVLPHVGSATTGTRFKMGQLAAENVTAVLSGRRPPAPVNPEVLASVLPA